MKAYMIKVVVFVAAAGLAMSGAAFAGQTQAEREKGFAAESGP